jgi:hypothetical protein
MKTAVEELAIALYEGGYLKGNGDEIQELVDKAKEMEKEKIKEAFKHGELPPLFINFDAEQYYNETYGGNK